MLESNIVLEQFFQQLNFNLHRRGAPVHNAVSPKNRSNALEAHIGALSLWADRQTDILSRHRIHITIGKFLLEIYSPTIFTNLDQFVKHVCWSKYASNVTFAPQDPAPRMGLDFLMLTPTLSIQAATDLETRATLETATFVSAKRKREDSEDEDDSATAKRSKVSHRCMCMYLLESID
jgi:hypothetical protein